MLEASCPCVFLNNILTALQVPAQIHACVCPRPVRSPHRSCGSVVPVQISRDGRSFCGCCVTGMPAGRTFPGPLVDVARKPSSHRKGPPRRKNKATGHKKPHEPLKITGQMVKELLQAEQEVDAEAGQKAAFPEGSSGSVPASAVGLEAMPGTGTGGWDQDMDYLENLLDYGLRLMRNPGAEPAGEGGAASQATSRTEPLGDAEVMDQTSVQKEAHPGGSIFPWGAPAAGRKAMPDTGTGTADAAGTTTRLPHAQKGLRSVFYMGTGCWAGVMAGLLLLDLILILCCVRIWCYWKKKWSTSGTSQDRPKASAMENLACHHASACQCPLSLPEVHYHLITANTPQPLPRREPPLPEGTGVALHPGQEVQPSSHFMDC
ncbi:uncharacterized protein LOC135298376 isoform X2 [Passer domesticus]|uniref:uncharacterized protein LOC135298376 isoform X2 n=1 Tax=Passer domesticus TaxID=48849 RepID=UPI0030FEC7F3